MLVLMLTISLVRTYMTQAQANKILVHKDLYRVRMGPGKPGKSWNFVF